MKTEKSVMGIVFCDDKVLVLQNDEEEWVFPKGHQEENETDVETACREVLEESGVAVAAQFLRGYVGKFDFVFHSKDTDIQKIIYVYAFALSAEQPIQITEKNFLSGRWMEIGEARTKLAHEDAKAVLERAIQMK